MKSTQENGTGDWEDVSESDAEPEGVAQEQPSTSASGSQISNSGSLQKKRRVQTKKTPVAAPAPPRSQSTKPKRQKTPIANKEELQEALTDGALYTVSYFFDVFKASVETMRKPLSWFLALYMFAWMMSRMAGTLRTAFSPLCILPGVSRSALCVPALPPLTVNFPKLVGLQESSFDQLIGESIGGSELSLEVLKAEMATKDLSLLVRFSDLKSRDTLADLLHTFAMDARKAGRGLSKLNARVAGAVDDVMAVNNYAMTTIEGAHEKAPSPFLQAISPIKLGPTEDEIIAGAFVLAMDASEQTIAKLVIEAEISRQNLDQMEVDVTSLHEIITREDKFTTAEKDELLGELWSKLGGNKKALREYGDRQALLNDLGDYRKKALAHVTAALQALHSMSDDLEVLRDRVAAPALLDGKLPLSVHIESIKNGLERLKEGRTRAREIGSPGEMARRLLAPGSE
ncbi:hypothetical protein HYDPIDRAFT_93681 [Hydnomerulius pinastri MD-312]|uniref:Unplaced genomic scaffold scaffold_19, whole genome shotgun sequence n=1 Tax=Hydnomerulius pinastri MD-312 TaxID=994086 RepID=A0A0C9W700_9AGAM|nr:hypothetical protein HYDPIDRAFT_93681 [Hydnomerulius pinastri MD-312]